MKIVFQQSRDNRVFLAIMLLSALALALVGAALLLRRGARTFSVYLIYASAVLVLEAYVWNTFFKKHRECAFGVGSARLFVRLVAINILVAVFSEMFTLVGSRLSSPLNTSNWSPGRIAFYFFFAFVLTMAIAEYGPRRDRQASNHLTVGLRLLVSDKKRLLWFLPPLGYVLSFVLCLVATGRTGASQIAGAAILSALTATIITILVMALNKQRFQERAFAWVALSAGLAIILPLPVTSLLSMDDEIHFHNASSLSYIARVEESSSDRAITAPVNTEEGFSNNAAFSELCKGDASQADARIARFMTEFDSNYYSTIVDSGGGVSDIVFQYSSIGYIPSALGLWLGRLLHLPYSATFVLGRVFNLISYIIVTYFAIKQIPVGKNLICAVALLPSNIFLAANYSYDPWLTSWIMLAVALTVREMTDARALSLSRWLQILLTYFIALGPKAVYFPLIALMMLIPSSKFESRRQKGAFYSIAIICALLIVGTFALELLLTGGGSGDVRGGEGVNSALQVASVQENPVAFAQTILSFVFGTYVSPSNISSAFSSLGYAGNPVERYPLLAIVPLAYLVLVSLLDGPRRPGKNMGIYSTVWSLFLCFATIFLATTALYFSYTPVGSTSVAGMQPRYLLPLVFPFCFFVIRVPLRKGISDRLLSLSTVALSGLYLLWDFWQTFSLSLLT